MDEAQARSLIAEHLGVPPASITGSAILADLGADPLDVVALVLRLERAFAVRISDAQAESCMTVADLFEAVRTARPLHSTAAVPATIRA